MDFEQHFILILGAFIINFFLFWFSSVGLFMVKESLKDGGHAFVVCIVFGSIFIIASFGLQSFAIANWLRSFY